MDVTGRTATAYAPAAVGNVAVGFDLLGHPIENLGDEITVTATNGTDVVIEHIEGVADHIPMAAAKNTAGAAVMALQEHLKLRTGFLLNIRKGIPAGSGMGGSGASAVAAVFAANALLVEPLETKTLLPFALAGEAVTTGKAPIDNVAPQLLGGLCLAHPAAKTPIMLPVPDDVCCVLIHPAYRIETRQSRSSLEKTIAMERVTAQSGLLAAFVSACYRNDLDLLAESLRDILVEPQRSSHIPGFDLVQNAAMKNSALGCSISGSGPSVFAWCRQTDSGKVADAMQAAFRQAGLASTAYISSIGGPGVRLLKHNKKIHKKQ